MAEGIKYTHDQMNALLPNMTDEERAYVLSQKPEYKYSTQQWASLIPNMPEEDRQYVYSVVPEVAPTTIGRELSAVPSRMFADLEMTGGGLIQSDLARQVAMGPAGPILEPLVTGAATQALGYDPWDKAGQALYGSGQQRMQETMAGMPNRSPVPAFVGDVVTEAAAQVPAIAGTVIGGPAVGATMLGTRAYGREYGEEMTKGATPTEATVSAVGSAATEGLTEYVGGKYLLKALRHNPANGGRIANFMKFLISQETEELSAEALNSTQDIIEDVYRGKPYEQAVVDARIPDRMKQIALQTPFVSALSLGAGKIAQTVVPQRMQFNDQPQPRELTGDDVDNAIAAAEQNLGVDVISPEQVAQTMQEAGVTFPTAAPPAQAPPVEQPTLDAEQQRQALNQKQRRGQVISDMYSDEGGNALYEKLQSMEDASPSPTLEAQRRDIIDLQEKLGAMEANPQRTVLEQAAIDDMRIGIQDAMQATQDKRAEMIDRVKLKYYQAAHQKISVPSGVITVTGQDKSPVNQPLVTEEKAFEPVSIPQQLEQKQPIQVEEPKSIQERMKEINKATLTIKDKKKRSKERARLLKVAKVELEKALTTQQEAPQQTIAPEPIPQAPAISEPATQVVIQREQATSDTGKRYRRELIDGIAVKPSVMQYRRDVGKGGVTETYRGEPFQQNLADPIVVWRDPSDKSLVVLDGHHRYNMAKESGASEVDVVEVGKEQGVTDTKTARMYGALRNIAGDKGTVKDAARLFRDYGEDIEGELAARGVKPNIRKKIWSYGLKISKASDTVWNAYVNDVINDEAANALSKAGMSEAVEDDVIKAFNTIERSGKQVTTAVATSVVDDAMSATESGSEQTLFGDEIQSNLAERAEIKESIRNRLMRDRRALRVPGSETGSRLELMGYGEFNKEDAATELGRVQMYIRAFDNLAKYSGRISDVITKYANLLKHGNKTALNDAYSEVKNAIEEELGIVSGGRNTVDQQQPEGTRLGTDIIGEEIDPFQPMLAGGTVIGGQLVSSDSQYKRIQEASRDESGKSIYNRGGPAPTVNLDKMEGLGGQIGMMGINYVEALKQLGPQQVEAVRSELSTISLQLKEARKEGMTEKTKDLVSRLKQKSSELTTLKEVVKNSPDLGDIQKVKDLTDEVVQIQADLRDIQELGDSKKVSVIRQRLKNKEKELKVLEDRVYRKSVARSAKYAKRAVEDSDWLAKNMPESVMRKGLTLDEAAVAYRMSLEAAGQKWLTAQEELYNNPDSMAKQAAYMIETDNLGTSILQYFDTKAATGRALNTFKVKLRLDKAAKPQDYQEIINDFGESALKGLMEIGLNKTPQEARTALEELLNNKKPNAMNADSNNLFDGIYEFWMNNILTGISTNVSNFLSAPILLAKRLGSKAIAQMLPKWMTGKDVLPGELGAQVYAATKAMRSVPAIIMAVYANDGGFSSELGVMLGVREKKMDKYIGKTAGRILRAPGFTLLSAGDAAQDFVHACISKANLAYIDAFKEVMGDVKKTPTREQEAKIYELSDQYFKDPSAEQMTRWTPTIKKDRLYWTLKERVRPDKKAQVEIPKFFRELHMLGEGVTKAANVAKELPWVRFGIPFVSIGANIAKHVYRASPVKFAELMTSRMMGKNANPEEVGEAIAGTAVMAIAYVMAQMGLITGGGPEDREERQAMRQAGWEPYSIWIGDRWFSYARYEPLASVLELSANSAQASNEEDMLKQVSYAMSRVFANKTFLRNAYNMLELAMGRQNPSMSANEFLSYNLSGFMPFSGLVKGFERALSPEIEQKESGEGLWQDMKDVAGSGIPFVSDSKPKKIVMGKPAMQGGGEGFFGGLARLAGVQGSIPHPEELDKLLMENKIVINEPQQTLPGGRRLTSREYEKYAVETANAVLDRHKDRITRILKRDDIDRKKKKEIITRFFSTERKRYRNKNFKGE